MSSLTPRQWFLYRTVKEASENGQRLSIKEIIAIQNQLKEEGKLTFDNLYQFKESQENHSNCGALYLDIDEINESQELDKIICKNNNQFYIGSESETIDYYNKLMDRVCHFSHKAKVVKDKISQDGQGKLITFDNQPIEETQARSYHETYLKNQNLLNEVKELKNLIKMYQNENKMWKERYYQLKGEL